MSDDHTPVALADMESLKGFMALASATAEPIGRAFGDGRLGCVLRVFDAGGVQLANETLGSPDPAKVRDYSNFSHEKGTRLLRHPTHFLSWESRDETQKRYQGAIRADRYVISVSGYPAPIDEAYGAGLCHVHGVISPEESARLMAISSNTNLPEVIEILRHHQRQLAA